MRATNDAIEHCKRHIERIRAEIGRREAMRRDTERHRRHLKTLQALLAVHERAREAAKGTMSGTRRSGASPF